MDGKILLLAFGGTKEILQASELQFPLAAPASVADVLERICHDYPALARQQRTLRLALNGAYAKPGDQVSPGDEVALIPPVAGG